MNQKTTDEIRKLLANAELDFELIENMALNNYLPKMFHCCPFTEELCVIKQCVECETSKKAYEKNLSVKKTKILQES